MEKLSDKFGRAVTKLRISVTDRCNMRCFYCMPAEGVRWTPKPEILTFDEILRLARVASELGVRKIRITGGEPLLREGVERLVAELREIPGIEAVSMTTNGYFLSDKARALARAGLSGINISLDSLNPQKFARITRRNHFERVMEGISAAEAAGLRPIKINTVIMRGYNDDEIEDLATHCRAKRYKLRFIEFMPLDGGEAWKNDLVVPKSEILRRLANVAPLEEIANHEGDPAAKYRFSDGGGEVGIIASVSEPFCARCNRIRLTADGKIMTCLFAIDEHDLKPILRGGGGDEDIRRFLTAAVWTKQAGHLINKPEFVKPKRSMSAIGG